MRHIFLFLTVLILLPAPALGALDNQFVTIINPVRVAPYAKNPLASLQAEYTQVKKYNLPATWLVTFDIIDRPEIVKFLKTLPSDQEIGVFMEISDNFANAASVPYNKSSSWHFAGSIFLSGYAPAHRRQFIDTILEKFKTEFGKYPKSVGAWWIDSPSLEYMRSKYGVYANLGLADQFDTDGYQVWGQYWSTPFYPSRLHAGIPASDPANKLDVVTVQWAPRDPLSGYDSSLYSSQDYFTTPQKLGADYFKKLIEFYTTAGSNQFAQVVVGLEADLAPASYAGEFALWMKEVSALRSRNVRPVTLSQFANWYRQKFPGLSPPQLIVSDDWQGGPQTAVWYQSPQYRLGLVIDKTNSKVTLRDWRTYSDTFREPYYYHPNKNEQVQIYIPSIIDSHQNPDQAQDLPKLSPPVRPWLDNPDGYLFAHWSPEAVHTFRSPKALLKLLLNRDWKILQKTLFYVSQSELDTLWQLSRLPPGKVLIADAECLQCTWHSPYQPAVFANHRGYIRKFSSHPTVANNQFQQFTSRDDAQKMIRQSQIKYIYLVNYEDYQEQLPFSPGDWNAVKIYENAHSQLWQIKK